MTPLMAGLVLFGLLLVLLTGGVWIAIALGAVAWFGLQFFTSTPKAPFLLFFASIAAFGERRYDETPVTRRPMRWSFVGSFFHASTRFMAPLRSYAMSTSRGAISSSGTAVALPAITRCRCAR